jgi:hypothetical protein
MNDELVETIFKGLKRDATVCVLSDWSLRNAARRCAEEVHKQFLLQPKDKP